MSRDQWLQEAVNAEKAGSIITCKAIVKETMSLGIDGELSEKEQIKQKKLLWLENIDLAI